MLWCSNVQSLVQSQVEPQATPSSTARTTTLGQASRWIRLDEGVSVIALRVTNPLFPAARYCGWTEIYSIYNRQYATLANTVLMELQFTTLHAIIYMHRYIHNNNSHRAILPFYTWCKPPSRSHSHVHTLIQYTNVNIYIHVVIVHIPNTSNVYIRSHKITLFMAGLKTFMPTILLQQKTISIKYRHLPSDSDWLVGNALYWGDPCRTCLEKIATESQSQRIITLNSPYETTTGTG